jgi:hypothetical protein
MNTEPSTRVLRNRKIWESVRHALTGANYPWVLRLQLVERAMKLGARGEVRGRTTLGLQAVVETRDCHAVPCSLKLKLAERRAVLQAYDGLGRGGAQVNLEKTLKISWPNMRSVGWWTPTRPGRA